MANPIRKKREGKGTGGKTPTDNRRIEKSTQGGRNRERRRRKEEQKWDEKKSTQTQGC